MQKRTQWLPDIDFMDCAVRQENLAIRGEPIMLQLSLVPAYALTVHKTQATRCLYGFYLCSAYLARLRARYHEGGGSAF